MQNSSRAMRGLLKKKLNCFLVTLLFSLWFGESFAGVAEDLLAAVQVKISAEAQSILENNPHLDLAAIKDHSGSGVLHLAAGISHLETLRIILERRYSRELLLMRNINGETALHVAVRGPIQIIELFLSQPDAAELLSVQSHSGRTALHIAVESDHDLTIEHILRAEGGQKSSELLHGQKTSPLGLALQRGNVRAVSAFLRAGLSADKVHIQGEVFSIRGFLERLGRKGALGPGHKQILDLILGLESESGFGWREMP